MYSCCVRTASIQYIKYITSTHTTRACTRTMQYVDSFHLASVGRLPIVSWHSFGIWHFISYRARNRAHYVLWFVFHVTCYGRLLLLYCKNSTSNQNYYFSLALILLFSLSPPLARLPSTTLRRYAYTLPFCLFLPHPLFPPRYNGTYKWVCARFNFMVLGWFLISLHFRLESAKA